MRALGATALATALAACGSEPAPPDATTPVPPPAFDLDIVVAPGIEPGSGVVSIWPRNREVPICEPHERFPHVGECESRSDEPGCDFGTSLGCLARMAIVRDGAVLAERADFTEWRYQTALEVPGLFDAPDASLVIEGCGMATIPLSTQLPAAPVIDDATTDGATVTLAWSADPQPDGVVGALGGGLFGTLCHAASPAPVQIGNNASDPGSYYAYLASVDGPTITSTTWGTVWAWNQQYGSGTSVVVPAGLAGDVFAIAGLYALEDVVITIDGQVPALAEGEWSTRVLPSGEPRAVIAVNGVHYDAGDTTDSIRYARADGIYVGSFPHVAPIDDLDFWTDGDLDFWLDTGAVTLALETDPSITRAFRFTARWSHPLIARILPVP
jgi:hypothetical protein